MSTPTTLTALLKAAPSATSATGLSALLTDTTGTLRKLSSSLDLFLRDKATKTADLDLMESPGIFMTPSYAANVPSSMTISRGILIVFIYDTQIYQILLASVPSLSYSVRIWTRCRVHAETVWRPWEMLAPS